MLYSPLLYSLDGAPAAEGLSGGLGREAVLRTDFIDASPTPYLRVKYVTDLILAGVFLLLALPLMAAIAIAIKVESAGPVLFRQERIGFQGRRFMMLKFRSMLALSPHYSYKVPLGDPRITKVGRVVRRSGLDELPQLWNVIRGDMSLIGPRPELPFIVEKYQPVQYIRHRLRPGITGWWQIHQRNIPETMEEDSADPSHIGRLAYDIYYLDRVSLSLDLTITLRTAAIMLQCLLRSGNGKALPQESAGVEAYAELLATQNSSKD